MNPGWYCALPSLKRQRNRSIIEKQTCNYWSFLSTQKKTRKWLSWEHMGKKNQEKLLFFSWGESISLNIIFLFLPCCGCWRLEFFSALLTKSVSCSPLKNTSVSSDPYTIVPGWITFSVSWFYFSSAEWCTVDFRHKRYVVTPKRSKKDWFPLRMQPYGN